MSYPGVCGLARDQKHIDVRSASVYDVVNYLAKKFTEGKDLSTINAYGRFLPLTFYLDGINF